MVKVMCRHKQFLKPLRISSAKTNSVANAKLCCFFFFDNCVLFCWDEYFSVGCVFCWCFNEIKLFSASFLTRSES